MIPANFFLLIIITHLVALYIGLISREEYDEVVNRKNSRKRRTTANPQFSSAALEAKRLTKLEIIAERKNRRQLGKQATFKSLRDGTESLFSGNKVTYLSEDKAKNNYKIENKQLYPGMTYVVYTLLS